MLCPMLKVTLFLSSICVCRGFFQWKNCVAPLAKPIVKHAHGCEKKSDVVLSCDKGYKISVLHAFFGHGHGYKATCDSSWIGQDCGSSDASDNVRLLCQDRRNCTVRPTESALGDTTCKYGLDADLFVDYSCEKAPISEYPRDTIALNSLELSPSPLTLPGTVNVSVGLTVKRHLPAWTTLKLKIQKKVWGLVWTTIPCVSNYGSCTYDNVCSMLRGVMFSKCDKNMERQGIDCDCPIPTGQFTLPTQSIKITKEQMSMIPVPNWLVNGKYSIKAEFLDPFDRHLGCIELQVHLDFNSKKKRSVI